MPDHARRIHQWFRKHTGWRAWEDLSPTEISKWIRWFGHHRAVLRAGGAARPALHATPVTVGAVAAVGRAGALGQLQELRRALRAMSECTDSGKATVQCAVALEGGGEAAAAAPLCAFLVEREFRDRIHVVFHPTTNAVDTELRLRRWRAQDWWRRAGARVEIKLGGGGAAAGAAPSAPPPPHSLTHVAGAVEPTVVLDTGALDAWDPQQGGLLAPAAHRRRGALSKPALWRRLGPAGPAAAAPGAAARRKKQAPRGKLWLFYMTDAVPHPHQLRVHRARAAGGGEGARTPVPWTAALADAQEPGEKLARFLAEHVLPHPGRHTVLCPVLSEDESHHVLPGVCTLRGFKPDPHHLGSVLAHVEPWVACENTDIMHECIRAGKRLVFWAQPGTRAAWARYAGQLMKHPKVKGTSYTEMAQSLSPAALRAWGQARLHSHAPVLRARLEASLRESQDAIHLTD